MVTYLLILEHVAGAVVCSAMFSRDVHGFQNHLLLMILWPFIVIPAILLVDMKAR